MPRCSCPWRQFHEVVVSGGLNRRFLDRRSGDGYSYGFLLTGDFHLWLSELFSPTIGVELKRMGSDQEWPPRPVGLFLSGGALKDADG
jgi:hypothetical protein